MSPRMRVPIDFTGSGGGGPAFPPTAGWSSTATPAAPFPTSPLRPLRAVASPGAGSPPWQGSAADRPACRRWNSRSSSLVPRGARVWPPRFAAFVASRRARAERVAAPLDVLEPGVRPPLVGRHADKRLLLRDQPEAPLLLQMARGFVLHPEDVDEAKHVVERVRGPPPRRTRRRR